MNCKIIEIASSIAIAAHDSIDQRRKYTDEPYWHHSKNVAYLVSLVTTDENMIAAAWLHDVLEDVAPKNSEYSADKLLAHVGEDVFNIVYALTEIARLILEIEIKEKLMSVNDYAVQVIELKQ